MFIVVKFHSKSESDTFLSECRKWKLLLEANIVLQFGNAQDTIKSIIC